MPRTNYKYSSFAIQSLLKKLACKADVQIRNIADCNTLSSIIAKSGCFVSDSTLGRLYGVISTSSVPSKYTLDILSQYIGEKSWDSFFSKTTNLIDETNIKSSIKKDNAIESELTLLKFCLHDYAFNPIVNYLSNNLELFEQTHTYKTYAILNVIDESIRNNENVRSELLPFISANEILRNAYFKYFMNIDGLNLYYTKFLENHYLKRLNPKESNYKNNLIWAYSVLITSFLYANNKAKILQIGYDLFKKFNPDNELIENFIVNGEIQFYPYARYHFSHIVYLFFSGKGKNKKVYENKLEIICNNIAKLDSKLKAVVLAQVFEALIVAKLPELIVSFSKLFSEIVSDIMCQKDKTRIHNEEESLIQMSYYYFLACKICNIHIQENTPILDVVNIPISNHLQYFHTYSFYSKSIQAIFQETPEKKEKYLKEAYNHAILVKNKFFIKQGGL